MKSRHSGSSRSEKAGSGDWWPDPDRPPRPGNQADPALLQEDRERALALVNVSRETLAQLDRFVELLLEWQQAVNLVAPSTLNTLWTRHIADSLQLLDLIPGIRHLADLGSGAGFPGLILACSRAGENAFRAILVEANRKKAAFLRQAITVTGAPALVRAERIEAFVAKLREPVDVVTARALAPLNELLGQAEPLLKSGAQAVFPKGQDVEAELTEATRYWNLEVNLVQSKTDPRARIVHVKRAQRRS
jgi:16S rRNA (guanine527-N7)-methyltransferase